MLCVKRVFHIFVVLSVVVCVLMCFLLRVCCECDFCIVHFSVFHKFVVLSVVVCVFFLCHFPCVGCCVLGVCVCVLYVWPLLRSVLCSWSGMLLALFV